MKEKEFNKPNEKNNELVLARDLLKRTTLREDEVGEMPLAEPEKEEKRFRENPALRDTNKKVYEMDGGSNQAVFYAEPIHLFDRETQTFNSADTGFKETDSAYVSKNGTLSVVFPKESTEKELFCIGDGKHQVAVFADSEEERKPIETLRPVLKKRKIEFEGKKKFRQFVLFENETERTAFSYSVTGNGVKEDIIIREKAEFYGYGFRLKCKNVEAKWKEDERRIVFIGNDSAKEEFYIPAAFMKDASGKVCDSVAYSLKELNECEYLLSVIPDGEWLNAPDRSFPVVIDPQIKVSGSSVMTTYNCVNGYLYASSLGIIGTTGNGDGICNARRMYVKLQLPNMPRNPRIKKAELRFSQADGSLECGRCPKFGLFRVQEEIAAGSHIPEDDGKLIDYDTMKCGQCENGSIITYSFDITRLIDAAYKEEIPYANLVIKALDENVVRNEKIYLYGGGSGSTCPTLVITYDSSYGVNTSLRTHTHELGCFGQGSIDLMCGNLMFESTDLSWSGNRSPVTIKHLYNSALSDYPYTANTAIGLKTANFSSMKIGNGYKLNIMQSMVSASFIHAGTAYSGYVYIDENGEERYFKLGNKQCCDQSTSQCYYLYEDVESGSMFYDNVKKTLTVGTDTYLFDSSGRLVRVTDQNGNYMAISYSSGKIVSVTDGAGRVFSFAYDNDSLVSITAPDLSFAVEYRYTGDKLSEIRHPEGKKAVITYNGTKPSQITLSENGTNVYRAGYTFSGDRVVSVTEYGFESGSAVLGASTAYDYSAAARRTVVTTTEPAEPGETTGRSVSAVYSFDNDGNVSSEYFYSNDTENTGISGEGSGIDPFSGENGVGVVSNINNLLVGHNFEECGDWSRTANSDSSFSADCSQSGYSKFGTYCCVMSNTAATETENGITQMTGTLPSGEYAFSAYVRIRKKMTGANNPGVYLRVKTASGTVLAESERLNEQDNSEYTRLIAPFTLSSDGAVKAEILMKGKGNALIDAAQLENNPYASAYNMLENGNFERGKEKWNCSAGTAVSTSEKFNMSRSLQMDSQPDYYRGAWQTVPAKTERSTRETFTLSGWAKGCGLPVKDRRYTSRPLFRLRAVVRYHDTYYKDFGTETYTADFSPCTETWQFASVQFSKSKYRMIKEVAVYCDYAYNFGSAFFDNIQLVRSSVETGLSSGDFSAETGDYDGSSANSSKNNAPAFKEAKDAHGNALTETTFHDGEYGTIYRSFAYNENGNDLISEKDARGGTTAYDVNVLTSRTEEVTDRCGNKTAYEYDTAGKTTRVISKTAQNAELSRVSYAYDSFDNMTEILRGDGMKYVLAYDAFHKLQSIGIEGKNEPLAAYTYKKGSGRLKSITYANGDRMEATYNAAGQMTAERWYDGSNTLKKRYAYLYDGQGNLVRSLDFTEEKEYTYTYEDGRIVRGAECSVTFGANDVVLAKDVLNTVRYFYDNDGKLTKKVVTPKSGDPFTVWYESPEKENSVVKFTAGGRTVTSHSKTDGFGRKKFDELQLGTGFLSREFSYLGGNVTNEHRANAKLKSSPTTQLVSQIVLTGGRTLSYEYDAEERITKVTDSLEGVTEYTYDALGQLLTETVNNTVVNTMTYDNYGNIQSKNGVAYTYGNGVWKDLLTGYNGLSITYDAQGNPTNYLGHPLTWEKGRQLKSFDNIQYTYNANGIRTSKTVCGVRHRYTLDGTKVLREEWSDNTLVPLYDNEDGVCGVIYNNEPFYFQKNLQGDVIAIYDRNTEVVARYTYDAWGKVLSVRDGNGSDVLGCCEHIAVVNPYRYRSYYYDEELGIYYLQSRYYDPTVGRFINGDEANNLFLDNSILSFNLYTYCFNSSVLRIDPSGCGSIFAIGIQFMMVINRFAVGLEFLWSTQNWNFYLFFFVGGSKSFSNSFLTNAENTLMERLLSLIQNDNGLSISSFSLFDRFSISVSFVAVLGNRFASFPSRYCGWFSSISLSFMHYTVSGAYSINGRIKIGSLGFGVTTSKASFSYSQTFYFQLTGNNALENNLSALKKGIRDKTAFLKLFACFF